MIQFKNGPMDNFQYIISSEQEAAIIDPAFDTNVILSQGHKITHILVTHTHFDHINKVDELRKLTNAKVYVHKNGATIIGECIQIQEGDTIKIGSKEIKVIETPGHLSDSVCFLEGNNLFTGDTLFIDACGRTDLDGGNTEELYYSLQKIKKMNENLIIYPGHDYGKNPFETLKEQLLSNPYLKCSTLEEFKFLRD